MKPLLELAHNIASHALPSIAGITRWRPTLFRERLRFTITRKFKPFVIAGGYEVRNVSQLIQAWELTVEAGLFKHWANRFDGKGVILDIGANHGFFGWLCRQRWSDAKIIGFEPHPRLAEFCVNLGVYDEVHNCALGSVAKEVTLRMTMVNDELCSGTTEEGGQFDYCDELLTVPGVPLDVFGYDPDVVKIDVDGAELEVVQGGTETMKLAEWIACECCGDKRVQEVASLLGRAPMRLTNIDYLFPCSGPAGRAEATTNTAFIRA